MELEEHLAALAKANNGAVALAQANTVGLALLCKALVIKDVLPQELADLVKKAVTDSLRTDQGIDPEHRDRVADSVGRQFEA